MKFVSKLSTEIVLCDELKVKLYKELLKCSYGDEPNKMVFIETLYEILSSATNKPLEYFKKLNIIDLFCLLLDTRINSQGDICKVVITKNDKQMNLELNLSHIRNEIADVVTKLSDANIVQNDMEVVFECPSLERSCQEAEEEYLYFIKGIRVNVNGEIKFASIISNEQAKLLFEKVSPKVSLQIIERFRKSIDVISNANFLSRYGLTEQKLVFFPSIDSFIWFTKLIFNESLETFYDNLFYLSHLGHMSTEYIENANVGEYNYFVSCLQRTLAAKTPSPEPEANDHDDESY